jgi:hypothetical protein
MVPPTLTYDGLNYTIKLVRDDKAVHYEFGEHALSVCSATPDELKPWELSKMKSTADDGRYYYLCAKHLDVGLPTFVWLYKDEAMELYKALQDAEQNRC